MAPLICQDDLPGVAGGATLPEPTRTLAPVIDLVRRQSAPTATVTVVADSANGAVSLTGGAIAGIVLGSIFGTLLLLWIFRSCMNLGAPPQEREGWYHDVEPSARRHSHHSHHSHQRRHSPAMRTSTTVEPVAVRRSPSRSPRRPSATYVVNGDSRGGRTGRYYASS